MTSKIIEVMAWSYKGQLSVKHGCAEAALKALADHMGYTSPRLAECLQMVAEGTAVIVPSECTRKMDLAGKWLFKAERDSCGIEAAIKAGDMKDADSK